jgi:hypothetical protein
MTGYRTASDTAGKTTLEKVEEIFFAAWCVIMPVTGTVLIPAIQGTIPAYLMAFVSVIFVLLRLQGGEIPAAVTSYAKSFAAVLFVWLLFMICSQIGLMISDRHNFADVDMLDPSDSKIIFRTSMFTQSIYLCACVLIALYFRYFFKESWMRYVFWGAYLLAGYGIYEWLYFFIFHQPGDFLVNRTFGESEHTASWSQSIEFGGLSLLRIKSTLGEPSFFAGVVIPYLFLALDYRKKVLVGMLIFTALFSTSTSCYLGLGICVFLQSFWSGKVKISYLALFAIMGIFLGAMYLAFPDTFNHLFNDKFSGDNDSGKARLDVLEANRHLLESYSIPNWLFGIGYGYVYNGVFWQFLINTGLLGLAVYFYILFRPILFLPIRPGSEGLKLGLLALAVLFFVSLSEVYLPPTWMFLGLAYKRLNEYQRERRHAPAYARAPGQDTPMIQSTP